MSVFDRQMMSGAEREEEDDEEEEYEMSLVETRIKKGETEVVDGS